MWQIKKEIDKKGSSNTTVQSYQPTEQEIRLQQQAADYAENVAPNALWLNNVAKDLLKDSLGTIQVDYNKLLQNATGQITNAQQGVAGLTQGKLPEEYQKNMEASIRSGVENTMGNVLNSMGQKGILNSSVTTTAMNDISKNAADTMAKQYQDNIGTLNGLYGQQAALAGQNIVTSAGAQEAAQNPAANIWNLSLGLNSGGTLGALNAIGGQGTTTSTQKTSGGSGLGGLFGGFLTGVGSNPNLFCFTGNVKVKTPKGEVAIKNIKKGDKVIAYNHLTDEDSEEIVLDVLIPKLENTVVVECDNGTVETTLSQPLLTSDGIFKRVDVIHIGDTLKHCGKVISVYLTGKHKVYDLKVAGSNTYYANGFIAKGCSTEWEN